MSTVTLNSIPLHPLLEGKRGLWISLGAVILIQFLCSMHAAETGELLWVFVPLLMAGALVVFLQPHWGLVFMVGAWFFGTTLSHAIGIYPADIILVIVAIGYIVRQLVDGRPIFRRTPIDRWLLLFIVALTISWLLSVNKASGFVNWGHHLEVLLFYFVVVGLATEVDMRRALTVFVAICVILSIWNVHTFLKAGGAIRAFGPAGVLFSGFLSLVATYATSRFLLADRHGARWLWGGAILIFVIGQLVNQSRGAMLQMMTGMVFAAFLAAKWGRIHNQPSIRKRMVALAFTLTVTGVILLAIFTPMLLRILERYSTTEGNSLATANMRIFLWKTAVHLFSKYPLFGVGLAQENVWVHLFPNMRFDPWFVHTRGIGFHNSMIGYLATTGIVGSLTLVILLTRTVLMGVKLMPRMTDQSEAAWKLGIWAMVLVIATRYLYEGHLFYSISGVAAATFFAFLGRLAISHGPGPSVAEGR